uniref:Uncharacterized protein n=1 Tax=Triticum urartu TaxID=4572 RepID=A0A8R7R3Q9_TRIUA
MPQHQHKLHRDIARTANHYRGKHRPTKKTGNGVSKRR